MRTVLVDYFNYNVQILNIENKIIFNIYQDPIQHMMDIELCFGRHLSVKEDTKIPSRADPLFTLAK